MKETYSNIDITYDESANRWRFELRGRERSSESLKKAKEAIDRPANDPSEKPAFIPQQAYYRDCGSAVYGVVTVTSMAENRYNTQEYWIIGSKSRRKVASHNLFNVSPENTALVAKINETVKAIDDLREVKIKAESHLKGFIPAFLK
jgi:hypothetical protein